MANDQKNAKKPAKSIDLRETFMKLSNVEQQGVTNFFNVHNIAHWIYYQLSAEAQTYISYCIRLNMNANERETHPDKFGGVNDDKK